MEQVLFAKSAVGVVVDARLIVQWNRQEEKSTRFDNPFELIDGSARSMGIQFITIAPQPDVLDDA
ncbi:MAG: hypothetical protein M3198_05980 [Actinomycetota bacterium]|nr:hypothetical protein [Actinomycetota bacterium]